jgi:DNA-nicking Smr family endonuclease
MSGDDDESGHLWAWAMRDVKPQSLRQRLRSSAAKFAARTGRAAPGPTASEAPDPGAKFFPGKATAPEPTVIPPRSDRKPPPLADFDRRKARKIARGGQEIDARIDLHGLRMGEAQEVLTNFLSRCHMNGCRTVLVITGKGRTDRDLYYEPFDLFAAPDRGVLKTSVPRWLAEAELRAIVTSYTTAAQKHGGEGALYVQLRSVTRCRSSGSRYCDVFNAPEAWADKLRTADMLNGSTIFAPVRSLAGTGTTSLDGAVAGVAVVAGHPADQQGGGDRPEQARGDVIDQLDDLVGALHLQHHRGGHCHKRIDGDERQQHDRADQFALAHRQAGG